MRRTVADETPFGIPSEAAIRVKPCSYQPSMAELMQDVSVDLTPEAVAKCLGRMVAAATSDNS